MKHYPEKRGIVHNEILLPANAPPVSAQAEHYIETVGDLSGRMLPVVDVEYYGNKKQNPSDVREVQKRLDEMFEDHPLWIRNVYYPPIDIGRGWQFWQYPDQGK